MLSVFKRMSVHACFSFIKTHIYKSLYVMQLLFQTGNEIYAQCVFILKSIESVGFCRIVFSSKDFILSVNRSKTSSSTNLMDRACYITSISFV